MNATESYSRVCINHRLRYISRYPTRERDREIERESGSTIVDIHICREREIGTHTLGA